MRIAAVSLAKFSGINLENRRNVNKYNYSNDVFVKSQPSFGSNITRLVEIKDQYLAPLIKSCEADWKHLAKIVDIDDANMLVMQKTRAGFLSLIQEPQKVAGYKIFSLVNAKLQKFDEYVANMADFHSLQKRGSVLNNQQIDNELNLSSDLFSEKPQIIVELNPLSLARTKINKDIDNGLSNIKIPKIDNSSDAERNVNFYLANPYYSATELSKKIDQCVEAEHLGQPMSNEFINLLFNKLDRVYKKEKSYKLFVSHLNKPISELEPAKYDLESLKKRIGSSTVQAKKIISHSAVKLDEIYRKKFAYMPETTQELEELLIKQKRANSEITGMIEARYKEIYEKASLPSDNIYDDIDYTDLPF